MLIPGLPLHPGERGDRPQNAKREQANSRKTHFLINNPETFFIAEKNGPGFRDRSVQAPAGNRS